MDVLRTPDERFAELPDFPFAPHYVDVDGLRVHYLAEGPADAEVVLLLQGEPSWSYLYRWMIPVLTGAGLRAVAIDLVGFGRSDKPSRRDRHHPGVSGLGRAHRTAPRRRASRPVRAGGGRQHRELATVVVDFVSANPAATG